MSQPYFENEYCRAFLGMLRAGDLCGRESCYHCSAKAGASGADISIGDFWGIEHVPSWHDDDRGVSAVIVHSEKGRKAFASLGTVTAVKVGYEDIVRCNPAYYKPTNGGWTGSRQLFQFLLRRMSPRNANRIFMVLSLPKLVLRRLVPLKIRAWLRRGGRAR